LRGGEKMFKMIIGKINKKKKHFVGVLTGALMFAFVTGASAAGADTETVTAITDGFGGVKDTALAVIGAIAGVALLLFAAPYAWQYAKRIFKTVAR